MIAETTFTGVVFSVDFGSVTSFLPNRSASELRGFTFFFKWKHESAPNYFRV